MKKHFLLLILACLFYSLKGQNSETDSLKQLLGNTRDQHKRVMLLEALSYAYVDANPDTALQYALKGLELAQQTNDRLGEGYCINALGNVYFTVGDYPKALEMFLQSLKLKEDLGNQQKGIAVSYFNIANVYTEQEDYSHALYYLFKAKDVDEKLGDSSGILFDLYSLSAIYNRMHRNDSALIYVKQTHQLAQRLKDKELIGAIINIYGDIYAALNNSMLAKKNYHLSISYCEEINDHEVLAANYYGLAKIFKQERVVDSSIFYARKSFSIAQQSHFLKQLFEASTFLAELFKNEKLYDSAFRYQELSITSKDSLYNVEKIKKVQNLKLIEQQRQQAMEVARTKYKNQVKLYILIFVSVIFLMLAVLFWYNNKQKQKSYILLQNEKTKTEHALNELKSTQAQLLLREKMASLGEVTAGIAHEIQNPLNFVNNFAEVNMEILDELKNEVAENNKEEIKLIADSLRQNMQKIVSHGKRADSIVKNMLQHSRTGTGQTELSDINTLTDEFLRISYQGFKAKNKAFAITLKTNFDKNIGKINIVPQEIGRVLLNVLGNAFYAVIEKERQKDGLYEPTIEVTTRELNDSIEILVKDNGIGIPAQVLDKIFQPFFTTKPPGQGTGLGLSLSYDIVKAHAGEIKVESRVGEGSLFTISLPRS